MTCESLKRGRGEMKSCFPFSFFKSLLFIFELFFILSNAKVCKNKYVVEKEKRKWWVWGERKIQMQVVEEGWKRKWDNYQFTS
jgi:hypothetical protein